MIVDLRYEDPEEHDNGSVCGFDFGEPVEIEFLIGYQKIHFQDLSHMVLIVGKLNISS